jgi:hypothetical protein
MQKTYFKHLICFLLFSFLFLSFAPLCLALDQPQLPKDTTEAKNLTKGILDTYIYPYLRIAWDKAYYYLDKEVEKRKPSVQQEFNKEVNELKTEAVKEAPSLWQRFLDLIH